MIFFPFGDFPNPPKAQWVTRILIGINVAVYLLVNVPLQGKPIDADDVEANKPVLEEMYRIFEPSIRAKYPQAREGEKRQAFLSGVTKYDLVVHKYGYRPGKPSLLALFLCMFLHGDFLHLFGNMLYLWIYGDNVEYRLGPIPFLIAYLGTGVIATISFSIMSATSMIPLVGASGAISGALGFYLIWFPYNYVRVFVWIFFFVQVIHVRAALILALYLVLDNILPLLAERGGSGGGVAHAAHIGGFIAGAGLAWLFNSVKGRVEPPRPDPGSPMRAGGPRPAQPRARRDGPGPREELRVGGRAQPDGGRGARVRGARARGRADAERERRVPPRELAVRARLHQRRRGGVPLLHEALPARGRSRPCQPGARRAALAPAGTAAGRATVPARRHRPRGRRQPDRRDRPRRARSDRGLGTAESAENAE